MSTDEEGRVDAGAVLLSAALGYAAGNIPTADLVSRLYGAGNLRRRGSGNPGAANALSEIGKTAGATIAVVDIAKGAAAGVVGRRLAGAAGANVGSAAAVTGHCYPALTGLGGGKGVATSIGQVLATFPAYFPIDVGVAVLTASLPIWKRRTRAATQFASATWVGCSILWWRMNWPNAWGPRPTLALPLAAAASSVVIATRFERAPLDESPNDESPEAEPDSPG